MLVVACVKQVPDTTQVKIDPVTNNLVREGIPNIMNPFDAHALEEALRIKDAFGLRVAVISMGPPNAEKTLRQALARGADRAILLTDRAFGGADTFATSRVLAEAVKRLDAQEEVALVITGRQTIDGDTGQVGTGIAARWGVAPITLVDRIIDIDFTERSIKAARKLEGRKEVVSTPLPTLISVIREINAPRYPTVPRRLEAEELEVETWTNETLGLDPAEIGLNGSPTSVNKVFSPELTPGEIVGDGLGDPAGTADFMIDTLVKTAKIAL